ncbi:MAG: hypothetical protein JWL64_818 [Frankiales bacterium]|nr:hypothetical protein [Frankiales bacterium]
MTDEPAHDRPEGVSDDTVEAAGTLSEAYEYLIRARGHLYSMHQLVGHADLLLGQAADQFEAAGHAEQAARLRTEIVGRNLLEGRWTFQVVEEFDDGYFAAVEAAERRVRTELMGGRRHVYESELKDDRRTAGEPGHERRP